MYPPSVVTFEYPEIVLLEPNDNFAATPDASKSISSKFGAGDGDSAFKISLNLSIAVPIGVAVAKSVNSPSV